MGLFSRFFKRGQMIQDYLERGAAIIDVRTAEEFRMGNIKQSINIPLDKVERELGRIKAMKTPLILCCASGARSGAASMLLQQNGIDCINGGDWMGLHSRIKR